MPGKRKGVVSRLLVPPSLSDLPTDSPKRKDSKLEFHGHLSHANPPITNFFHPEKKISTSDVPDITESSEKTAVKHDGTSVGVSPVFESPESDVGDASALPALDKEVEESDKSNTQPSPTPHKMIYIPSVSTLLVSASSTLPLVAIGGHGKKTKSRRKLNPSQTANQQVPAANSSKLPCCNKGATSKADTQQQPSNVAATSSLQHKLTEYFPVRRSVRKTKKTVMEEKQRSLEEAVLTCKEDGLEVHNFEGKGRGVVARRLFLKGEFVVEYAGELIQMDEAREREKLYAQDQNTGCYMYYFKYRNLQYCVDATPESDRLGRLVNHSRSGNLSTKTITINNLPRLVLIAKEDIQPGEEVTYDYGDRSKESLKYHPWLAA